MCIRQATDSDFDQIWPIFSDVVSAGETYGYRTDTDAAQAQHLWMQYPRVTYVAEEDQRILGTYYLKTNHDGPGPMSATAVIWWHQRHAAAALQNAHV